MTDITVVVLVGKEELHIRRCLEKIAPLEPRQVFVIESQKGDRTHEIAKSMGATTVWHDWPGNQAEQFNWALDNLPIESKWVLRLDADEYLLPELVAEIKEQIDGLPHDVNGVIFKRKVIFCGKWVKRGVYPVRLLRLFRMGAGRSEQRTMDEHVVLTSGESIEFRNDFVDENLQSLDWWFKKHLDYAEREAVASVEGDHGTARKGFYLRLPLYWRAIAYFLYRYILRGGFLEGRAGFKWHFFQGLWYRLLVDSKIEELQRGK